MSAIRKPFEIDTELYANTKLFDTDWDNSLTVRKGDYMLRPCDISDETGKILFAEVTAVRDSIDIGEPCYGCDFPEARVDCGALEITESQRDNHFYIPREEVPEWLREEVAESRNDPTHAWREQLIYSREVPRVVELRPRPSKRERLVAAIEAIREECLGEEAKDAIRRILELVE